MSRVVVFVPGIMGSVLKLQDEVIWPGSVGSLIFSFKKMKELLDPALVATDIIRSFSISNQYGALLEDLTTFGFVEGTNLYLCPYDWRKSNVSAASVLGDVIDTAAAAAGATGDVILIAHSMGGLIARYYLESGAFATRPGYGRIRALITLATPHRGAPLALAAALGMEKRLFLSAEQVQTLGSDPRYPSLYQLLPSPAEPFAWDDAPDKAVVPLNVYDPALAGPLGLVQANLDSAQAFRAVLDQGSRPEAVRYFYFGGTRMVTTAYVLVRLTAAQKVRKIDVEDSGDGTVPVWSSGLGTGVQWQPVGGEHGTIYKASALRQTLGRLLGYIGVLAAEDLARVEVAVRERVIEPEEVAHISLAFGTAQTQVQGRLLLERAEIDGGGVVTGYMPYGKAYPIAYTGIGVETLSVTLDAPALIGIYRVVFESVAGVRLGQDDLFVQEPS